MSSFYDNDVTDLHRDERDSETSSITNRHSSDYYRNSNGEASRVSSNKTYSSESGGEGSTRDSGISNIARLLEIIDREEVMGNQGGRQESNSQNRRKENVIPDIQFPDPNYSSNSSIKSSPRRSRTIPTSTPPISSPQTLNSSQYYNLQPQLQPSNNSRSIHSTPSPSVRAQSTSRSFIGNRTGGGGGEDLSGIDGVRIDSSWNGNGTGIGTPSRSLRSDSSRKQKGRQEDYSRENISETQFLDSSSNHQLNQDEGDADAQQEFNEIISQTHSSPKKNPPLSPNSYSNNSSPNSMLRRRSGEIISVQPGSLINSPTRAMSRLRNIATPQIQQEFLDETEERNWNEETEMSGYRADGSQLPLPGTHYAVEQQEQSNHWAQNPIQLNPEQNRAQPPNSTIFGELRQSKEMIKSLITEVAQLREQLAQATTTATEYRNRKVEPTTPTIFQLEPTTEEIWDFVKCVIASHPNLPLPTTNLPIKSISNNLQFTRKLDRLIHHSEKNRRDEEIFDQENLEIIIGRVRSWGLMM